MMVRTGKDMLQKYILMHYLFENDVKMYGIQTDEQSWDMNDSLRMM